MKAVSSLLCALAAAQTLSFSLCAEEPPAMSEAVSRLEASKTFGVAPAAAPSGNSPLSQSAVTGKNEADLSGVLEMNPFKSPLFAPPPPEALPQTPQQRTVRRVERTIPTKEQEKEANWLIHGVEEQTKLMEDGNKALQTDDASNALKKKEEKEKDFAKEHNRTKLQDENSRLDLDKRSDRTANSLSSPFNSGLGIYSRYTLKGMESMQQSSASADPLSIDSKDHFTNKSYSNPADAALNAADIQSPIIDPLASTKMNAKAPVVAPNSRLSVEDWMAGVKERERASLLPQQPPTMQGIYDQNQVRPKAPEPKPTAPPVVYNRPKAETMKNSLPPNRTIKDPNDF